MKVDLFISILMLNDANSKKQNSIPTWFEHRTGEFKNRFKQNYINTFYDRHKIFTKIKVNKEQRILHLKLKK